MGRLDGKVAIITGAAQGMGIEHARLFVAEGAAVALTDVLVDVGKEAAATLGPNAAFFEHDVTDPVRWKEVVQATADRFGPVTVLVNNAGVAGPAASLADLTDDDYQSVISVDQTGTFYGMRAVIPGMIEAGGGSIINISSIAGFAHSAKLRNCAYTAAKFAVRGLTKAAAVEYGEKNIRVNSVHPAGVLTPMLTANQSPETIEMLSANLPLRRMARPEEVSHVVAFLASDESSYMTGTEHIVDGGALAS
jgi:3alpha(or 20beta)-hydroxysteroid dehydrogenase